MENALMQQPSHMYHLFCVCLDTCSKSGGLTNYCQFDCNVSISNTAFNF